MIESLQWTLPVSIADLPDEGKEFELVPDETARAALARRAGVLAVPALRAHLRVQPNEANGAMVIGKLDATVRQTCVVTLEPFDNSVAEEIVVNFVPAGAIAADEEGNPPDIVENGVIDLAAVAVEFLILGIDPYPRKPGAVFQRPGGPEGGSGQSAFAALTKLKRDNGKS